MDPRRALVAICGTAGRDDDYLGKFYTRALFSNILDATEHYLELLIARGYDITLISGGAPWAEHIAVKLHQERGYPLQLKIPAVISTEAQHGRGPFVNTDPGSCLNELHALFSDRAGVDSARELYSATEDAMVSIEVFDTFHSRNKVIAESCTHMLAFTWNDSNVPKPSGTLNMWKMCKLPSNQKNHVSLYDLCPKARDE